VLIDKWEILLYGDNWGEFCGNLRKIILVEVTLWDFFVYQKDSLSKIICLGCLQ